MIKIIAFVLIFSLCLPVSAADPPALTADSVRARIHRAGPSETLRVLVETQTLESLITGVAAGDSAWLLVAASLRPSAAPNIDLALDYAVGHALLKEPTIVLQLFGVGFTAEHVCAVPFWEPDPEQARRYVQEAEIALAHVREPRLESRASECMSRIRANGELNY